MVASTTPRIDDVSRSAVLARIDAGETVPIDEIAELIGADRDGFGTGTLGLRWTSLNRSRVVAHLDVDTRHHQPYGIVHGGVWCAVVESVASTGGLLQVASQGRFVVGVNNTTDFLRPHREGGIEAVGTPVHVGRTQQLWQVVLTRAADAKVVARGQVRLQNVDPTDLGGAA